MALVMRADTHQGAELSSTVGRIGFWWGWNGFYWGRYGPTWQNGPTKGQISSRGHRAESALWGWNRSFEFTVYLFGVAIYYFRRHASRWELSWSKENLVVVDWKNWRRILRGFYNRKKTWGERHVSEDARFCFCEFFLLCPTLFLDGSLIVL